MVEIISPVEQMDDAGIRFQYARILVNGLVFNIGGRIEGYTNLIWNVLIALGIKLGVTVQSTAQFCSLVASLLFIAETAFYTTLLLPRKKLWYVRILDRRSDIIFIPDKDSQLQKYNSNYL